MTHALLLNPFNSTQLSPTQEPAQTVNRQVSRETRSTPVCASCQSDDVIAQATAQWSNESQEWELASTFGQPAHCNHCNSACEITWMPMN